MRKRALVIEQFERGRKGWILKLSSTDQAALGKIIIAVRECEKERGLLILNRQDPFEHVFDKAQKSPRKRKVPEAQDGQAVA